jgi:uncharacterized protein YcnI
MPARATTWTLAWLATGALVVLAARTLAYALEPGPSLTTLELERPAGGPRLVVVTLVALGLGLAVAAAVVWLAALAVRERRLLERAPLVEEPRLRLARLPLRALALWAASSLAFALLESYLHWRAGLGWHGLHCLLGPIHRDALPLLFALSLVAAALVSAAELLVAWIRRTLALIRRRPARLRVRERRRPAFAATCTRQPLALASLGARGPPPAAGRDQRFESKGGLSHMVQLSSGRRGAIALAAVGIAALATVSSASAHAELSPPVAKAKAGQVFTLAVPTEEEGATTTRIELTPPAGFAIDSFAPAPGWKRNVQQTGSGEEAVIQKVTWTGGNVPTGEDAIFQFLATPDSSKTYTFSVRQTYSNGKVVDWSGPESSDTPAPTIEAKSSLAGGGSSTLALIALVVGALGLIVAIVALVARQGGRTLA